MRQLSSLDAQFLALEDARTYGHVSGLAIYDPASAPDGTVTIEDVRALVAARIHLITPFRRRVVEVPFGLDYPYWIEDPDFDLDFHVRELALPAPGDDEQLGEQIGRIVARPLDRSRPLWELYAIQGLAGGRMAILTKVHHSAVDGLSGAEIISILLDPAPEGRTITPPQAREVDTVPGQLEMLGRGILAVPTQPLRALRALPRTLPNLDDHPTLRGVPGTKHLARLTRRVTRMTPGLDDGGVLERTSRSAPRTMLNGRLGARRRVAFGTLSLQTVKEIKNAFEITVNDVVVALCASALRTYLLAHDGLPAEPLLAMIPVSVRTPEQAGTFGNRISSMIVAIPTDEADPVTRLMRAHDAMRSAKERHQAMPATLLQDANHVIPPALLARAARVTAQLAVSDPMHPPVNVVISNVPGSTAPLYLAGAQLIAQYPLSVLIDGLALNITVLSYRDNLDFGLVGDRDQIPDLWRLIDDLRAELDIFAGLARADPVTVARAVRHF